VSIKIDMLPNVWTDINGVCFLCQFFILLRVKEQFLEIVRLFI
jgi:hypothetical protein